MNKRFVFIFVGFVLCHTLTAATFRPHSGIGYTTSYGKGLHGIAYHFGGRFLLEASSTKKYGLEITYIKHPALENKNYLALGIILEQIKFNGFNMSIGTIGYINAREKSNPFGLVTNLGWEPQTGGRFKPFVTYRSEWIFDHVILGINSISIGISF